MAVNEKLMKKFAGVLNEKLNEADYAVAYEALGLLLEDATKAISELDRLTAKVGRLAADNRELRTLLAESRRVHRAASEDHGSESFLGRLFGV